MFKKSFASRGNNRPGSNPGRSSYGARPSRPSFGSGPARSSGGYRGANVRSAGPRSGGGRGGRKPGARIDPARFINKVIVTEEVAVFVPEHKFIDFKITDRLKENIVNKGYVNPMPIQDRTIPLILEGRDVVGIANTGTGKTAAFLIPLINKVLSNSREKVLVVVPTRELAQQIDEELRGFTKGMKIFSVCCVGGAPIGKQLRDLRYEHQFVIGTPGRLKDLIERRAINLSYFKSVVLDEADRMLDMGFINDMRYVMSLMAKDRHTLFFSATLNSDIEKLIGEFLNNPVRISVKTGDTSKNVEQDVVRVKTGENKVDVLHTLLNNKELSKVLIFGRTKHGVERLSKILIERGFKAESIHGDKNQSHRQRALASFKDNRAQILVATDVAARGLDIADVSHVINYDLPETYEDYVHRIGRTGRANKRGKALTFVE